MAKRKRMNYLLKTRGLYLNVELEDLLDSSELPGETREIKEEDEASNIYLNCK